MAYARDEKKMMDDWEPPLSPQELAEMLNEICNSTLEAIQSNDMERRKGMATGLREIRLMVDYEPEMAAFMEVLARWLEGEPPTRAAIERLDFTYRRAIWQMVEDAKEGTEEEQAPISRRVLAQLVSAVVIAEAAGDVEVQRTLAAHLVTVQGQLDRSWRKRMRTLLENLRAVLGGADPRSLPMPEEAVYQQLWLTARELLLSREFSEETAGAQLLDRLVHNAVFTLQANSPELTVALTRSLLDVQRQALTTNAMGIANLVAAIRAHLQGMDATPLAALLQGDERAAWQRILEETEPKL
jgi:hypothetical protein